MKRFTVVLATFAAPIKERKGDVPRADTSVSIDKSAVELLCRLACSRQAVESSLSLVMVVD